MWLAAKGAGPSVCQTAEMPPVCPASWSGAAGSGRSMKAATAAAAAGGTNGLKGLRRAVGAGAGAGAGGSEPGRKIRTTLSAKPAATCRRAQVNQRLYWFYFSRSETLGS
jgi:hypothetical protein